jgi:hypothetical protein
VQEDPQMTNGTLTVRAEDRSSRELSVGVVGAHAPVPCVPTAPDNRDLRGLPPWESRYRGPRSELSTREIAPTRAMMWAGSIRPFIAVTINMAKRPLPRGLISRNPCGTACPGRDGNEGVVHSVLQ